MEMFKRQGLGCMATFCLHRRLNMGIPPKKRLEPCWEDKCPFSHGPGGKTLEYARLRLLNQLLENAAAGPELGMALSHLSKASRPDLTFWFSRFARI